jgi:hypothetical protein
MNQVPSHYFKESRIKESRNASSERNNDIEQNRILYTSPEYGGSPEPLKKR